MVITTAFAQSNRLQQYRVYSFGGVTRVTLTFTQRPITNVLKEANSLRVLVNVPNCELGNMPDSYTTPDALSRRISITRQNRELNITINTGTAFSTIRQSSSQDSAYHLNIDIFKNLPATTLEEYVALLDYYNFTRNNESINQTLSEIPSAYSSDRKIMDRQQYSFAAPIVYTPRATAVATTQPTQPTQPTTTTTTTTTTTPKVTTPPQPPVPITRPSDEPTKPIIATQPPPSVTSTTATPPKDTSFTLIARTDRFPSRIAQTKNIFNPQQPDRTPPPPVENPPPTTTTTTPQAPPTTTTTTPQAPPTTPTRPIPTQPPINRTVIDIADLQEIEKQILNYYNIVKIDSTKANFMVGLNANIAGDYRTAIDYLKTIPESDINYENAIRWLSESYLELGDTKNADFYKSLITPEESTDTPSEAPGFKKTWNTMMAAMQNKLIQWSGGTPSDDPDAEPQTMSFIDTPVSLWMAAALALFTLIIGGLLAIWLFRAKKKKLKTPIPDADLAVHNKNLEKSYENKDIYKSETIETINNEVEVNIADKYEDPPIVTESLDKAEEAELIADEKPPATSPPTDEEPVVLSEENSYKHRMVKTYNDTGWAVDEIAKELQISQREVEFILKNP